jgi:hypothetical protein
MSALGRLSVLLSLDSAEFTSGLTDAERKAGLASKKIADQITNGMIAAEVIINKIPAAIGQVFDALQNGIKGVDALNDLKDVTGDSIQLLASLELTTKASANSFEDLSGGLEKLTRNLAASDDEGKGAGRALEALGIEARNADGSLKKAGEVTVEVANALANYSDGASKAAIVTDLFSKQGVKLLPTLKDIAEQGLMNSSITDEQAQAAEDLIKAQARAQAQAEAMVKQVAVSLIPTFVSSKQAFMEVAAELLGVRDASGKLLAGKELERWADGAGTVIDFLGDLVQGVGKAIKTLGLDLGAAAAQAVALTKLDFKAFNAIGEANSQDRKDVNSSESFSEVRKRKKAAADFDAVFAEQERRKAGGKDSRPDIGYSSKSQSAAGAAKEKESAYAGLNKRISESLALMDKELQMGRKLTEQEAFVTKMREEISLSKVKLSAKEIDDLDEKIKKYNEQSLAVKVLESQNSQASDNAKARQDLRNKEYEEISKFMESQKFQAMENQHAALEDIKNKEFALTLIGKTNSEIEIANGLHDLEAKGIMAGSDAYESMADSIKKIAGKREELEKMTGFWKDFDSAARTSFNNLLDGASDPLKSLGGMIKTTLYDELYRLTVKKWIINISAETSGSGSGSNWLGMFISAFSGGGSGGTGTQGSAGGLSYGSLDGARANGGSVKAGGSYLVGEMGPEVVTFGSSGNVTPNYKARGMFDSGSGKGVVNNTYNFSSGVSRNEVLGGMQLARQAAVNDVRNAKVRGLAGA